MNFVIENWMLFSVALMSGGMLLWPLLTGAAGASSLTANGAVQLINRDKAVVVDVRDPEVFAAGHIVGAKNLPLADVEQKLPGLVKNKGLPVLLVCPTGARANKAAAMAKKLGYDKAQAIGGGMKAWAAAGLPVEKA